MVRLWLRDQRVWDEAEGRLGGLVSGLRVDLGGHGVVSHGLKERVSRDYPMENGTLSESNLWFSPNQQQINIRALVSDQNKAG